MSDHSNKSDHFSKAHVNKLRSRYHLDQKSPEGEACESSYASLYSPEPSSLGASSSHRHRRGSTAHPLAHSSRASASTKKAGRVLAAMVVTDSTKIPPSGITRRNSCYVGAAVGQKSLMSRTQKNQYRRGNKLLSKSAVFCISSGFLKFSALQCRGFACGEV